MATVHLYLLTSVLLACKTVSQCRHIPIQVAARSIITTTLQLTPHITAAPSRMGRTGLSKLQTAGRDSFQIETTGGKRERETIKETIKVPIAVNLEFEKKNAESRPCGCRVGQSFWTVAESVDLHSWQSVNPRVEDRTNHNGP